MNESGNTRDRNKEMRLSISVLEADVAYFDARLAMLEDEPDSHYQLAQIEIYGALQSVLSGMLQKLQGHKTGEEGMTVSEILLAD